MNKIKYANKLEMMSDKDLKKEILKQLEAQIMNFMDAEDDSHWKGDICYRESGKRGGNIFDDAENEIHRSMTIF